MLKDNKIANSLNIKKSYLSKLDRLNELDQMINRNTLLIELNLSKRFLIERGNPKVAWDAGINSLPIKIAIEKKEAERKE